MKAESEGMTGWDTNGEDCRLIQAEKVGIDGEGCSEDERRWLGDDLIESVTEVRRGSAWLLFDEIEEQKLEKQGDYVVR